MPKTSEETVTFQTDRETPQLIPHPNTMVQQTSHQGNNRLQGSRQTNTKPKTLYKPCHSLERRGEGRRLEKRGREMGGEKRRVEEKERKGEERRGEVR